MHTFTQLGSDQISVWSAPFDQWIRYAYRQSEEAGYLISEMRLTQDPTKTIPRKVKITAHHNTWLISFDAETDILCRVQRWNVSLRLWEEYPIAALETIQQLPLAA